MAQHVRDGIVDGLEQLNHLLNLLVEQGLVDLGEVAGLQRIEWGVTPQEVPEVPQHALVSEQSLADGPVV